MSLKFTNLSKQFDASHKRVLEPLNFSLKAGQFSGLLGPSGCGKTTLLRILAGLDRPTTGRIQIDEEVWTDVATQTFIAPEHRNVGMVFQSYAVWPHMNVFENVAFSLRVRKIAAAEIQDRVLHLLNTVGLNGLETRMPNSLSGGQQQRVALARALAQRPRVLLLDEPLSNLDASLRAAMRAEIRRLHDEFKITSVIVTHDWDDARALCDQVVVLKDGHIEQQATPDELMRSPASDFVRSLVKST